MNVQRTQVSRTCQCKRGHGSKSDATGICPHLHRRGLSGPSASHGGFWRCPRGTVTRTQPLLCSLSTAATTAAPTQMRPRSPVPGRPPDARAWSRFAGAQVPCESSVPLLSHALSPVPLYFLGSELPAFSKWIALIRLPGMVFLGSSARDVSLFALKDQMPPHAGALP